MLRRCVVAAVAALVLITPVTAHAGFGWGQWRDRWLAQHAPAIDPGLRGEPLAAADRAWRHAAWIAYAEWAKEQRRPQEPPGAAASTPGGSCYSMIAQAFGSRGLSVGYAYAIALRESNCNPNAWNPIGLKYGHASGVFQILYPGIWEQWDGPCGFESSSVFNAWANISVAACMVSNIGWRPWAT